jgi:hypothetical protein
LNYDTVTFSDKDDKELFKLEIFYPYKKNISEKNYKEDYLYLFGGCDLRWNFEPISIEKKNINNIEVLRIEGQQPPRFSSRSFCL